MKIGVMQKIDFFIGIPLTFACSVYLKARHVFFPPARKFPDPVRNILCIELSEMGSMIQLIPLLARMKERYPGASVYFVTFHSCASALRLPGVLDKETILTLRTGNLFVFAGDLFRLIRKLRSVAFDITFDFELFSRISSLLSFISGAPVKTGFDNFVAEGLYRGNFLTHPVSYNHHQHIAKNFLAMWYAVHEPWGDLPHSKHAIADEEILLPARACDTAGVAAFQARLYDAFPALKGARTLVLLNPNSSEALPLRRWPLDSYLALTQNLMATEGMAIGITGTKNEAWDASFICDRMSHPRVVNLSGFTTLPELIALYHTCDLLITNDSGPAQFSALAQVRTITFFGPETPYLYGPLNPNAYNFYKGLHCSPCYTAQNQRRSVCTNNLCMQAITVEEVSGKAFEMLGISPAPKG